jgi:hypothetical protein
MNEKKKMISRKLEGSKEWDRLSRAITRAAAEELIVTGQVQIDGRRPADIQAELYGKLEKALQNPGLVFAVRVDHSSNILRLARSLRTSGESELACLLFATWFEHFLNGVIRDALVRRNFLDKEIERVLKETRFAAKATWILKLLSIKPINEAHKKTLEQVVERRNAFVHYKWKNVSLEDPLEKNERVRVTKLLAEVEKAVAYLRKWEEKTVFKGRRSKILPRKITAKRPK